jgi:hypothetical protein
MEISTEVINCRDHDGFECIRYRFDYTEEDRDLMDTLKDEGEVLASGSDGRMARDSARGRSSETQSIDGISGVVAEWVWIHWLTKTVDEQGLAVDVGQDDDWDNPKDQVDITVERATGETFDVEVRASFPYAGAKKAICKYFDIIGWYNNEVKKKEIRKDYYVRVLFPFDKFDFWTEFKSGSFDVYLSGGAPREMLENSPNAKDGIFKPHWQDESSNQEGTYRMISPIVNAMDTPEITDDIIS